MANPATQRTTRQNVTRIALIPLLGIVLLAVVFWSDEKDDVPPAASSGETADVSDRDMNSQRSDSRKLGAITEKQELQQVELSDILAYNPFALPEEVSKQLQIETTPSEKEAAEQERKRIASVVEHLQMDKLNVVFQGEEGAAAILGDRVLHEGDEIETGIRIRKITPQGLTLEVSPIVPADSPSD
jgi:hypothetical protein